MAIGQVLLAGFAIFFWVRALFKSFDSSSRINPLPTVNLSIDDLVLTATNQVPTSTPWAILQHTPTVINTPTFIPTQTPFVVTATLTPTPISTPWYENIYIPYLPGIVTAPNREPDLELIGRISMYYPPYAYNGPEYEINCDKSPDGQLECEHMANGDKVVHYVGEACACPPEFPFGTIFQVLDGYYTCRDRGGAIVRIDNERIWLDLLYPKMPDGLYWAQEIPIKAWLP